MSQGCPARERQGCWGTGEEGTFLEQMEEVEREAGQESSTQSPFPKPTLPIPQELGQKC